MRIDNPTFNTGIIGTTTNDNAAAGNVGEIIESEILVGSAVALTHATAANITSISLTAGDWDVWGSVFGNLGAGTSATYLYASVSTTSATLPTAPNKGAQAGWVCSTGSINLGMGVPTGMRRLSLASTTTVYLVAFAGFSVSTLSGYGYLGARRRR